MLNEKKTDTHTVGGVAPNSNRTRLKYTSEKIIHKCNTVPNDRGDGGQKRFAPEARVDKSKPAKVGVEEAAVGQRKRRCPNKKVTERHHQTKQKTKDMLNEVKLLLSMDDKFNKNINASKSYLRSVQKTLSSSLKNIDTCKNEPGIDPEILNLVHEPIKMSRYHLFNRQIKLTKKNSQESLTARPENVSGCDKRPPNSKKPNLQKTEGPQDISKDVERETNVKALLTFWNDKLSNKVDSLYNCLQNHQKHSPPALKPKNVLKLNSDGVDEEHTLKPSDIKVGKGPPGIAELLTMNSKNIIRQIKSHKNLVGSSENDGGVRAAVMKDQIISQLQQNKTFKVKNKDKSVKARIKKILNTSQKTTTKHNSFKENKYYMVEELKKETIPSASHSYMYIVNYLVDYVNVFRSKPKSSPKLASETVDCLDAVKKQNQLIDDCKFCKTNSEVVANDGGDELTITLEKIIHITGIKAGILLLLLQIMNKTTLPGNLCKLSRADLKNLSQLGHQLISMDSSIKGKLLYYLFDIEKMFSYYKECVKLVFIKAMYFAPKASLLHKMKHEAMGVILFRRHRYFTVTFIVVVFCLAMLLLASSI